LFRDSYTPLTAGGLAIYGLSTDSPKANTNFKEKQKLPYPLLCDPAGTLIAAIGLRKTPSGTQRGVFIVDKKGHVLAAEPGGPQATVDVAKRIVEEMASGAKETKSEEKPAEKGEASEPAKVPEVKVNGEAPKENGDAEKKSE
jgi:peroxiredoxin Q/BCP